MSESGRVVAWRVAIGLTLMLVALCVACRPAMPDREVLDRSWSAYRSTFVTTEGRVVRPEHGQDTVSEGQAYTMLRAVWMNDRATFDRVWRWARDRLARSGREHPALWAWHWTPDAGGRVVDWSVATDADTDAALALLMASERWPSPPSSLALPPYDDAARAMLADLLTFVVPDADGVPVMLAGAWADERALGRGAVLNPSYFSPAAYRVFAARVGDPRWTAVADGAYVVLNAVCRGTTRPVVPDWVRWTSASTWRAEGEPRSSWDAIRVPWRVATDVLWFDAPDARAFLAACIEPSLRAAAASGRGLAVERDLDGQNVGVDDHPLANALFAMAATHPGDGRRLLERVRARLVTRDRQLFFDDPDRYYVNSLAYLPFLARSGGYTPPRRP